MTYATPKDRADRAALVERYLAVKNKAKQQFLAEKIGQSDLQFESARLFNPITSAITTTSDTQAQALKALQDKTAQDNENLLKAIAYQTDVLRPNPFIEYPQAERQAAQAQAAIEADDGPDEFDTDLLVDADYIKSKGWPLPSAFIKNRDKITEQVNIVQDINRKFRYKDKTPEEQEALRQEVAKNQQYVKVLQDIKNKEKGFKKKGTGLILEGDNFGKVKVDPSALKAGRLRAYKGGALVMDTLADASLYELMTKKFVEGKTYTPQAVNAFRELVKLSEIPIYGRRHNKKSKLILEDLSAVGPIYYNNPNQLIARLNLLIASRHAGNTGLDNEISSIVDELVSTHVITKDVAARLY